MPKLSALQRTKSVAFEWPETDEALNLVVYPDRFTGKALQELQTQLNKSDENETSQHFFLCEFLAYMIGEWDLTYEDGKVIPITSESLFEELPITLVVGLLDRIKGELSVNPLTPES